MIDKKEQRLGIVAFWLALLSIALGIMPLQLLRVLIFFWGEPADPGYAGFGLLIACPMWLGSLLSWLTSLVMVVIIAFRCRPLLFTKMGIATLLMQEGILVCIGAIAVSIIYK